MENHNQCRKTMPGTWAAIAAVDILNSADVGFISSIEFKLFFVNVQPLKRMHNDTA